MLEPATSSLSNPAEEDANSVLSDGRNSDSAPRQQAAYPNYNMDGPNDNISRRQIQESQSSSPIVTRNSDGEITIAMDELAEERGFYVKWTDLSYTVKPNRFQRPCDRKGKTILNNLNGFFLSSELIALMGPSGAGKTTLLECLCLKNKEGVTGNITVVGRPRIRMAVVPQYDNFLPQFTVTETIFYASRYKNRTYDISHRAIVRRVIQQLGLEVCQDNNIQRCSGGQRKRVAIATELVKKPNLLILDEPTSGLDSSSCCQTIAVLRRIIDNSSANTPMSMVITIHQPSSKVFSLFDRVYLMASGGRLAFNGSPKEVVPLLERIGSPCPAFYNPTDHLIEVVAGDYGIEPLNRLIQEEKSKKIVYDNKLETVSAQSLRKALLFDPCPFESHLWIHIQRSTIQLLRDPILFSLRISLHFMMPFFFALLWGLSSGRGSGCPTFNRQSISPISVAISGNLTREEQQDTERVNDNLIFSIYGGMFTMYAAAMITVLSFPLEVKVLAKEYFNGWYSVATYLVGKITSDAPFQIFCVVMFASISYYITDQPKSDYNWRFIVYAYSLVCLSLLSQTQGLIVGALFMNNLSASVFVGPLSIAPVFLFSGFARRYSRTADYLKPLIKSSYFHHAVKTIYSALYGFGRCKCNPSNYQFDTEEIDYEDINTIIKTQSSIMIANGSPVSMNSVGGETSRVMATGGDSGRKLDNSLLKQVSIGRYKCDETFQSLVMEELQIEDNDMYFGMMILFIYLLVLRGIVLLLLMYKVKR